MINYSRKIQIVFILALLPFITTGQTFVEWFPELGDGYSVDGTYPGGTVTASNLGNDYDIWLFEEFDPVNLNGATVDQCFGSIGSSSIIPSNSLQFTFSTPVTIASLSIQDLDQGDFGWNDNLTFEGITFSDVQVGGGVMADGQGTISVPYDIGNNAEHATWLNATAPVTSFTINYNITNSLTHAYLAYSITLYDGPTIFGETQICPNQEITLTANDESFDSWEDTSVPGIILSNDTTLTVSPSEDATFMVYNDVDTLFHTVNVLTLDEVISPADDIIVCENDPDISLSAEYISDSFSNVEFLWNTGSTASSTPISQEGEYWFNASISGCSFSDTINVFFNPLPTVNLGDNLEVCDGDIISLENSIEGATYLWSNGSTQSSIEVTSEGTYILDVTLNGCTESDNIFIGYNPLPEFSLGNDTSFCPEELITVIPDDDSFDFVWSDGSDGAFLEVTVPGVYSAEGTLGICSSTDDIIVSWADCESLIVMPNVFTPNGDELNNLFQPILIKRVERMNTKIFNRWGTLVYETNAKTINWPATDNSEGVYYYVLEYVDLFGNQLDTAGTVTLLR